MPKQDDTLSLERLKTINKQLLIWGKGTILNLTVTCDIRLIIDH